MKPGIRRAAALAGPPLAAALALVAAPVILGPRGLELVGYLGIYVMPGPGKAVVPIAVGRGVDPWWALFYFTLTDILLATFLVLNWDVLERMRGLGPRLLKLTENATRVLDAHPWIRQLAFLGLVLLVVLPLHGTGAIGGAIAGRLLGFPPSRILAAVALGGALGNAVLVVIGLPIALM